MRAIDKYNLFQTLLMTDWSFIPESSDFDIETMSSFLGIMTPVAYSYSNNTFASTEEFQAVATNMVNLVKLCRLENVRYKQLRWALDFIKGVKTAPGNHVNIVTIVDTYREIVDNLELAAAGPKGGRKAIDQVFT